MFRATVTVTRSHRFIFNNLTVRIYGLRKDFDDRKSFAPFSNPITLSCKHAVNWIGYDLQNYCRHCTQIMDRLPEIIVRSTVAYKEFND